MRAAVKVGVGTGALWCLLCAAQSKKPGVVKPTVLPFSGSYEDALQRANDRNVPMLLIGIVESEDGALDDDIRAFRDSIFAEPELQTIAPRVLLALAANRAHEALKLDVVRENGTKDALQVCSVYRTQNCSVHQKMFDALYREHNADGELRSPAALVLGPDRKVAKSWQTGHAPAWGEILDVLKVVQNAAGEGLTEGQLADVRAFTAQATREFAAQQWGAGHATWGKLLAVTSKTRYSEDARRGQAQAVAELDKARAEARECVRAGRIVDGYVRLLELAQGWKASSYAKDLEREIAALEKDKSGKDAIAAYKREREAEALWNEARGLEAAKEAKKAEAKLRQLLRKFGDTPAGQRAREAYPDLARDEEQKRSGG
jgi:tetratricopeptide (TPR) repeat protein